jgi:putative flippase GtrA/glycosyltransferase involved in cell wall biosynthesis
MSNNFQKSPTSSRKKQSQIQQNGHNSTPEKNSSNGASQFKVHFTPRIAVQPGEQLEQGNHHLTNGAHLSNGAGQFRVPTTPFLDVPTTPLPTIPATPFIIAPRFSLPSVRQIPPILEEPRLPDLPTTPLPQANQEYAFQWSRLLPKRIMGFSIVGGSVMVGGITLLFILVQFLHVEANLAYLIQAVVSIETNFFLNRFTNWKERNGNLFAQWLKFHSTSAITLPLNQGLFALLTWLGVPYLVVTVMGAGIAAFVNYLANDRFVFHGLDIAARETMRFRTVHPVSRLPHVGIVIPVRNSERTIGIVLSSVLRQDYQGQVDIFIVGNPPTQDSTWQSLAKSPSSPHIHYLQILRPSSVSGRDANMKRYQGSVAALRLGVDIVALLDSQVEAPPEWLRTAVSLLHEEGTDGVAGISCRHSLDHSLSGIYQDGSLVSEHPRFGKGFVLRARNFGEERRLPVTANLLLTRNAMLQLGSAFPRAYVSGWEDFELVRKLVRAGCSIFCTDQIFVMRLHKRKLRLVKQFSSGISAITFFQEDPSCLYAQRRLFEMSMVYLCVSFSSAAFLLMCTIGNAHLWVAGLLVVLALFGLLTVASMWKARDWRGVLFPLLDILHIGFWVAGALYALLQGGSIRPSVNEALGRLR